MATDSAKTAGIQEQRQLAAMKEKLAGLEAKQKQYEALDDHPDHDHAAALERTKSAHKELAGAIAKLEGLPAKEAKK